MSLKIRANGFKIVHFYKARESSWYILIEKVEAYVLSYPHISHLLILNILKEQKP